MPTASPEGSPDPTPPETTPRSSQLAAREGPPPDPGNPIRPPAATSLTSVSDPPDALRLDSSPSTAARVLAFASVVIAGACGGLIGFAVVDLGCSGSCTIAAGLAGVAVAVGAAAGTAVVAVLVLRSSAEWRAWQRRSNADGARIGKP